MEGIPKKMACMSNMKSSGPWRGDLELFTKAILFVTDNWCIPNNWK